MENVVQSFYYRVKARILRNKSAFLLNKRLEKLTKRTVLTRQSILIYPDNEISLTVWWKYIIFPAWKKLVSANVGDKNSCEHAIASLHGCHLRDDITRSFGRMLRRQVQKIADQKKR